jgi:epoxyqueuosine reductase
MNLHDNHVHKSVNDTSRIGARLLKQLHYRGYKATLVPIERVKNLGSEINERQRAGQFAYELYRERYKYFEFDVTAANSGAKSIFIIAAPQPHVRMTITLGDECLPLVIPPTYSTRIDDKVERILKKALKPAGYDIFRRSLPLKLLAVRSGLARYGRNNLAYVEGMGSYCRLLGFYTGLPVKDSIWTESQSLTECEKCVACIKKCPTAAINGERFLIRAELCLTFHNEREVEFPPEVRPEWHHCLIGCLYCQSYCPINKKVKGWIEERGNLSAHDSEVILNGGPPESLSNSGRQVIDEFGFTEGLTELSRNLKAVILTPGNIENSKKLLPN